jgi:hypothetical protein
MNKTPLDPGPETAPRKRRGRGRPRKTEEEKKATRDAYAARKQAERDAARKSPRAPKPPPPGDDLLKESTVQDVRMSQMDKAIREYGWSVALCMGLARKWDIAEADVYRIRNRVLERMREAQDMDLPLVRAQFLAELRDVRRKAQHEGRFGPVSSLLKMEAQILGLFAPIELHISANPLGQRTDAELERIVAEEGDRLREAAKKKKAMPGDNVIEASFATAEK